MRTLISRSLTLPALIFSLSYSVTAIAGIELIGNGTFTENNMPSSTKWTSTASKLTLKTITPGFSSTPFETYGGVKEVWACSSSSVNNASFSQENAIIKLNAKTRYRLKFNAFRDTSVSSTDKTNPAAIIVRVKSGTADYAVKDVLIQPSFYTGANHTVIQNAVIEFVTPAHPTSIDTTKLSFSFDGTKSFNSGDVCLSRVSLQEVDPIGATKVVVNTVGYPMQGKKVAVLSVPADADLTGYTWNVYYRGKIAAPYGRSVDFPYYAVKLDAQGKPMKGADGTYIMDTNSDGSFKIVGTARNPQQNYYAPPNGGKIPAGAAKDVDSTEYTYTLDFSDLGLNTTVVSNPNNVMEPFVYKDNNGNNWYVAVGSGYSTNSTYEDNGFTIVVKDKNGNTVTTSQPFAITNAPFDNLKKDALYSFYHQRSGEAINPVYGIGAKAENASQARKAGHTTETAKCFTGQDLHGNDWGNGGDGCKAIADNPNRDYSGGWYDAADHGKYIVNGGVALWTLQNLIERLQKKSTPTINALNIAFPAGALGLPDTFDSNGKKIDKLSELMAEARKEMNWMLKMQIKDVNGGYTGEVNMNVPIGNQATKQQPYTDSNNNVVFGPTSPNTGVYQVKVVPGVPKTSTTNEVRATEKPFPSDVDGDVAYAGGTLPRLRIKLKLTSANVTGMVFHSLHDTTWTNIPLDPSTYSASNSGYLDPKTNTFTANQRLLMYPTTAATLNFAAVAAQCSRIWKDVDPTLAGKCLTAAEGAWKAANRFAGSGNILRYEYTNTSENVTTTLDGSWTTADSSKKNKNILTYGFALNPMFNGGGAYGDLRVSDEFLWASKELKLTTTKEPIVLPTIPNVHSKITDTCGSALLQCFTWVYGFDWQNTSPLGYISSWVNNHDPKSTDATVITTAAKTYAAYAQGYNFSKIIYNSADRNTYYDWGANGGVLNRALIMLTAYEINIAQVSEGYRDYCKTYAMTGAGTYTWVKFDTEKAACKEAHNSLNSAVNSMGYLLGRNALGKSFISGYGANSMAQPHHRWFAKAADVNYPTIPAGFIAGGPNTRDLPALRANTPRYSYEDMSAWKKDHSDASEASNTEWQVGDLRDSSHKYLETEIITKCTTGLGNADRRWVIPEANKSGDAKYISQKCYDDDYRSFATNEIAINWQAPLVWVSQALSEIYK